MDIYYNMCLQNGLNGPCFQLERMEEMNAEVDVTKGRWKVETVHHCERKGGNREGKEEHKFIKGRVDS